MIALLQRVDEAKVTVDNNVLGEIGQGLMVLLGVEKNDDAIIARRLIDRILGYRVFADDNDKMNLNLGNIDGGLLLVPQFTLTANTNKGTRPSFSGGALPKDAEALFSISVEYAISKHPEVGSGKFGADMKVSLVNNGPVTFTLRV